MTRQTIRDFEQLFEAEGAATKDEFTSISQNMVNHLNIPANPQSVAEKVLERLVSQGAAHTVELSDLDKDLFVSNKNVSNSKMTRREINLD